MTTKDVIRALRQLLVVLAEDEGETTVGDSARIAISKGKRLVTASLFNADDEITPFVGNARASARTVKAPAAKVK